LSLRRHTLDDPVRLTTLQSAQRPVTFIVLLLLLSLGIVVAGPAAPAAAFTTVGGVRLNAAEARMVALVNRARTSRGLPALRLAPGYTDVARRWSANMARRRTLFHNPRLAANVIASGGRRFYVAGENVAYGGSASSVFPAYMASPAHRRNILSARYRYIGVGWVESANGPGFTTTVFAGAYSSSYGGCRVAPRRGPGD
jgi:uncharacterized protein YkwD